MNGTNFFDDNDHQPTSALSSSSVQQPPLEFITAFTPCSVVQRAATWNCQQLRFIFDEKKLDSVAQYLASSAASFDLIFLQEILPGGNGEYRLKQLLRAMNGGNSLVEPRFRYLLGRETTVLDTSSPLNAIIYPASWTLLQHASLTSFLHPPVMAWFKTPHAGQSTVLCASIHVSPSVGMASSASASQESGVPSTPSKATSSANKATMQTRLHLQLGQIVEQAQKWEVSVPSHLDQKDLSPRWMLAGDYNMVPDSLPHALMFTTPRGDANSLSFKAHA